MSTKPHKVVLKVNANGRGSVTIDGVELRAKGVHICVHAGELTQVALDLVNCEVVVEADGTVSAIPQAVDPGKERPVIPFLVEPDGGMH